MRLWSSFQNQEGRERLKQRLLNEWGMPLFCGVLAVFSFFLLRKGIDQPALLLIPISGIFAALWCSWKGRAVYLLFLGCITCFERHFILHYGDGFREIGTQALITLHITDRDEILAYLSMFKLVEYLLPLLFLFGIIAETWMRRGAVLRRMNYIGGWGAAFSLTLLALCQTWRPVGDYLENWKHHKEFYLAREQFRFYSKDTQPDSRMVCVLVIGESHRKKEFDELVLGGDRAPALKAARERGEIWEFDDMISHYQQTWFSVFTLLTRRGGETQDVMWKEKGLAALFKEAGFRTYYLTYQKKTPSTIGYDCVVNEADVYFNHRQSSGTKYDHGMLPELDRILKKNEKKVLVIIKMVGVHFNYQSRHPSDFTPFKPCYTSEKVEYRLADRLLLENTYRNAMYYNATFFDELVQRVSGNASPSFMVFLSDHGVVNFDDGKNPFFGAAKSNFHIPCFIYGNDAFRKQLPAEKGQALTSHRKMPVSNTYIFETMASLAGITYPDRRDALDLSSPNALLAKDRPAWVWKKKMRYDELNP